MGEPQQWRVDCMCAENQTLSQKLEKEDYKGWAMWKEYQKRKM